MSLGLFDLAISRAPKETAMALARSMLCFSPEGREWSWQLSKRIDAAPAGQWFAVTAAGRTTYMRSGESGRFSLTPPDGIDPHTLAVIDQTGPVPTELTEYFGALTRQIVADDAGLGPRLAAIDGAIATGDDCARLRGELFETMDGFRTRPQPLSEPDYAAEWERDVRRRYLGFEITGRLAATQYALARIAKLAPSGDIVHQAIMRPGALDLFDGPEVFRRDIVRKMLKIDGAEALVAQAAAALQADAEALADKATAAPTYGEFYGMIFEVVAAAYAAYGLFDTLAGEKLVNAAKYKLLANVCDERVAPAAGSLSVNFLNAMDWRSLRVHRAKIAQARSSGGERGANDLADQYITLELLYPEFLRPFLLGQTDDLRLQAAQS